MHFVIEFFEPFLGGGSQVFFDGKTSEFFSFDKPP